MRRRDFLKTAGSAAAAGLAVSACSRKDPYLVEKPPVPGAETWTDGEERRINTVCGQCEAGCGIRVRVVEGRAVKIEGNPDFPINRGGVGPKGQSGVQLLYHPDRIRGPLRREGPRGSGKWSQVTWDEAIGDIASRLRAIRAKGRPKGLAVLDGEPRGVMHELWDRFLEAYGSPNHVGHASASYGGKVLATYYMHGVPELPAYDWENARYMLGFGTSLFESWCQSIHLVRAASRLRRDLPGRRVKFVQVSPRFSTTAAKADEWVPIEPATYGALALALAHVLIREKLYDAEFVRDHTFGFETWNDRHGTHRGFKDLALEEYPPDKVARITGISVETIERLAREMAENRPTIALADGGAAAATNGLGTAMSIHALNALLGNLERPGGMLIQRTAPLASWPAVRPDAVSRANLAESRVDGAGTPSRPLALSSIQNLPNAIAVGKPYPVEAMFLYRSNPIFSKPGGSTWADALERVPLIVSFSPLPDESTIWADYVLPDHTYLERWDLVQPAPGTGVPVLGLRRPAVEPLHDTRSTGDVVIRLAQAMGPPVSAAFPWEDYRSAMDERLVGLLKNPDGSVQASEFSELRKGMEEAGGWWSNRPAFSQWKTAFRTPSGKFEFYSQSLASRLRDLFPDQAAFKKRLAEAGVNTSEQDLCLPHWEPAHFEGSPDAYPFVVVAYRGIEHAEGGARHLPWLRELPLAGRHGWKERVELNPRDAGRLNVRPGEKVWVETPAGRRQLVVVLHPGTRPGTIGLPLGHGPWPPNAEQARAGGGVALLDNASDPLAGIFALQGTRARIVREA